MQHIHIQYCKTQIGELILGAFDDQLCLMNYRHKSKRQAVDRRVQAGLGAGFVEQDSSLLQAARRQLDEYLAGGRRDFDLPVLFVGTDFQKQVWTALCEIPYGQTTSYQTLAQHIGKPSAVRAVANANGANALSVIVPCHRVIGTSGKLIGYGGGLEAKQTLLDIENTPPLFSA